MSQLPPLPNQQVLQQAAEWFATLCDEQVSEQDKSAWQQWLNSHGDHQRAWLYVEKIGQRFHQAQSSTGSQGAGEILRSTRNDRINRRKLLSGGIVCLLGILSWRYTPVPRYTAEVVQRWNADYRTATGETLRLDLSDGGQLWLNTASAVDVDYSRTRRQVALVSGEILIQTGKDPAQRPFTVTTREGHLRALGTRFSVRELEGKTRLAVTQGAVKITTQSGQQAIVAAGWQTQFTDMGIEQPRPVRQGQEAWIQGLIIADDLSLQQLTEEIGRYHHVFINVEPEVADIRVIGAYPTNRLDHCLSMLEDSLAIKAQRTLPWWVSLGKRSPN